MDIVRISDVYDKCAGVIELVGGTRLTDGETVGLVCSQGGAMRPAGRRAWPTHDRIPRRK